VSPTVSGRALFPWRLSAAVVNGALGIRERELNWAGKITFKGLSLLAGERSIAVDRLLLDLDQEIDSGHETQICRPFGRLARCGVGGGPGVFQAVFDAYAARFLTSKKRLAAEPE